MDGFTSADIAKTSLPTFSEKSQKLQTMVEVLRNKIPEYGRVFMIPLMSSVPGITLGKS